MTLHGGEDAVAAGGRPRLPRLKAVTLPENVYREPKRTLMAGVFFPGETLNIRALAEGWVSRDRASEIYRATIRGDGTIDHQATGRLRAD